MKRDEANAKQSDERSESANKKKRASTRYWVEIRGRLYARLQYQTSDRKSRVKYQAITDKRTARTVVEQMRQQLRTHGEEVFASEKLTFEDVAARYEKIELVDPLFQNGVKVRGLRSARSVRVVLQPVRQYFGRRSISTIKPNDLKAYKDHRLNTPVETKVKERIRMFNPQTGRMKFVVTTSIRTRQRSIASVNRELSALRSVLNFAVSNDWLTVNPFSKTKGIISLSAETQRDRVLSFEEEARLLAACSSERVHLKPIVICALDTAMRQGEIFKMRWSDVDFETGEILIPQTNTKTEQSRRVALTSRLRKELERLWDISPHDLNGLVFGITNNVKRSWTSACREANIHDFRFHDCRHTATTRMVASGSPHTEVMKITGHSQIKTFLRYLSITTETTNRVASRLDDYVGRQARAQDATVDEASSTMIH